MPVGEAYITAQLCKGGGGARATVTDTGVLGQPAESTATREYVVVAVGDALGLAHVVHVRPAAGLHVKVAVGSLLNADSCTVSDVEHSVVRSGNALTVGGMSLYTIT